MSRVFLSLGSNMGIKKENLDKAVGILKENEFIHKVKASSYYTSDPVGYLDQDVFVNIAVELETDLLPLEMLAICHKIEASLHRKRLIRWGPRTIDVDIILFGDRTSDDETLTLPHPRACERGFVLLPLMELDATIKINDIEISELIKNVDIEGVRKIDE